MRTPEEITEEIFLIDDHGSLDMELVIEVVRARDAEVRAETLAGLEWVYETSLEETGPCMSDEHDEHDGAEYVSSHCYFPFAKQTRYLRGPREPAPTDTDTRESTP